MSQSIEVRVCGVDELPAQIVLKPRSVVSIWDPDSGDMRGWIESFKKLLPRSRICVAKFDDIALETPGRHLMKVQHLEEILNFTRTAASPILVHCRAGVSRSTAVAYAILCQARGPGHEMDCMAELTRIRPQAAPNEFIVGLADKVLKREGEMLGAYRRHMQRYIVGGEHEDEL